MSKAGKYIPQDTITRLSLYLRSLRRLSQRNIKVSSSEEITRFINISADQFRKDLSYFGGFGRRGIGYDVEFLSQAIENILGTNVVWKIALVGVGRLGFALLEYAGFLEFNIQIVAAFDKDPGKIGKIRAGVRICDISKMRQVIKDNDIRIAILSVPAESAQKVSEELVGCRVKAILNFAPVNLVLPKSVYVANVDMASELESLIYRLKRG